MREMNITVIGIGGIGTKLLYYTLPEFLAGRFPEDLVRVTLVDGDAYEDRNRDRQHFHRIGNKADVAAEALAELFPKISFTAEPRYVTDENALLRVGEDDIIFLCVDNHATRRLVSKRCEELRNVVLISGGNDFTDGNIQVFVRKDGASMTAPLTTYHPEIENPRDKRPDEAGCAALAASGNAQITITNNDIAAAMLNAFYAYLEGNLVYGEVYCDIVKNSRKTQPRLP